jgi:peptide/nickel transport system substrate-binding protein
MNSISKAFRLGSIGLVALAALGLAGGPASAQQKVLKVVPHADLKITDPIQTAALITRMHALMVYDTLLAWDEQLVPKPQMVESYSQSQDRLEWRFKLRPGLKFHDGKPVTSADVVPSIRRWMVRDLIGQKLNEFTADLAAVDADNFVLKLKEPYGFVEYSLGSSGGVIPVIVRAEDAATDPHRPVGNHIGSGPFKFLASDWVPGSKIPYAKNPDYVPRAEPPSGLAGGHVVKVDGLEFTVIPDSTTVAAAIGKGDVDFWDTPPIDLIPTLERNRDLVVQKVQPLPWFFFLRPNTLFPPFNNPKAREALAYAVDQKEYLQAAIGQEKWYRECFSFFVCGTPFGQEVAAADAYRKPDLDKAKRLLAEAGYKGERIVLINATDIPSVNAVTLVTAERLKKIGVNVDVVSMDAGSFIARWNDKKAPDQGGWHLFHAFGSGSTWHHPLTNLGANMTCGATNWAGWPCDEEAARLRDRFVRSPDRPAQVAAAAALQERMWQAGAPYIMNGQYDQPYVWRRNVAGVLPTGLLVFWNVTKE